MKLNTKSVKHNTPTAEQARLGTLSGDDIMREYITQRIVDSMKRGFYSFVLTHDISDNIVSYLRNIGYNVRVNDGEYPLEDPTDRTVTISWK